MCIRDSDDMEEEGGDWYNRRQTLVYRTKETATAVHALAHHMDTTVKLSRLL